MAKRLRGYEAPVEQYAEIYPPEDTPEEKLESMRSHKIIAPRIKTTVAGSQVRVEAYPLFRCSRDAKRSAKAEPSTPGQQQRNNRRAIQHIEDLLNTNFTDAGSWLTLTYDEEHLPATEAQAKRDFNNFLECVRYHSRKQGMEPLALWVSETRGADGTLVRAHHHVVISCPLGRDELERLWQGRGRTQGRRLQPDEKGLAGMANYLAKEKANGRRRWGKTQNLKNPKVTTADRRASKAAVYRAAASYEERVAFFTKLFAKNAQELELIEIEEPRYSDVTPGAYLCAHFQIRPAPRKRTKKEPPGGSPKPYIDYTPSGRVLQCQKHGVPPPMRN